MRIENKKTQKMVLSAVFVAIGIVLPFITMQIPEVGNILLPMHIPVILCGFFLGWKYGIIVGFILPLLRSMLFGMPPIMPVAISMSFELAAYGFITGYMGSKRKGVSWTYFSLIIAMLVGRIIWGIVSFVLYQMLGNGFTLQMFFAQGFLNAIPGIIVQLILIPIIIRSVQKAGTVHNV